MAYDGVTLLYLGGTPFPLSYINEKTYKILPDSRTDLDSGLNNANGVLNRSTFSHYRTKIEFETRPLTDKQFQRCVKYFTDAYTNKDQRRLTVNFYDVNTGIYRPMEAYMPDWTAQIDKVTQKGLKIAPCRFAFIEY